MISGAPSHTISQTVFAEHQHLSLIHIYVDKILNVFCQHGASSSILVDAHPHIGTDKLPRVIENMRNTIIDCGGEVHFETRMDSLIIEKERIIGIETNTGKIFKGPVILATGHSARDVYRWLHSHGVQIETKGCLLYTSRCV